FSNQSARNAPAFHGGGGIGSRRCGNCISRFWLARIFHEECRCASACPIGSHQSHDHAAFLNSLIDGRSFNWTQMFMDLERILPGGVRLVSIELRQAKGHVEVKLTVGASSDDAKLKFLRALEESHQFSDIQLDSELPAKTGNQRVVELTAVYSRS